MRVIGESIPTVTGQKGIDPKTLQRGYREDTLTSSGILESVLFWIVEGKQVRTVAHLGKRHKAESRNPEPSSYEGEPLS